jgi:hypothetical protein
MTDVKDRLRGLSEEDQNGTQQRQTDEQGDSSTGDKVEDRDKVQALVPPSVKQQVEETWQKISGICSLSGREVPLKNNFYTAALLHGVNDLEAIAEHLGISDAYDEYRDVIE